MKFKILAHKKEIIKLSHFIEKKISTLSSPIEIGILKDTRYNARQATKSFARNVARKVTGGPIKKGKTLSKTSNSELADLLEAKYGIFTKPLKTNEGKKKIFEFYEKLWKKGLKNAPINTIRSLIIQPILQGKYGFNVKKINGHLVLFRNAVDTGQFVDSIAVRVGKRIVPDRGVRN